jgi:hypothetical protein
MTLADLLRQLREDETRVEPPPELRDAVMDAWNSAPPDSGVVSGFSRTGIWREVAALAAGVVLVVGLTRLGRELQSGVAPPPAATTATLHLIGEPFLEGEPMRVVRMRVPASTLASLGLRSMAGELAETVDVDVMVGEDGVARAIRVEM